MTRDRYRSIGAIIGLVVGFSLMKAFGLGGVLVGAVFGASGALIGGIVGEQVYGPRDGR
ncbi:hypothetical protein [Rhodopirellula sp. MGV]|uniref:hypothetical protein n=1 Tax=Rhodopirellula sp. MGV TaxID=2023130 RepID=UPI0018E9D72D|nr:hypothetical protein [Rhodopirellula sp. MGV]